MNLTNKYYEHSGAFGPMGLIYIVIFGTGGSLVLSAIYGYAIFYIPFVYLNFFITLGFGGLVGLLVGLGGKFGKVRNSKLLLFFGLLFGLLAEYAGWVSWIFAYTEQEVLIQYPSNLWTVIKLVAENGAWSMFGWTPTGTALYIIWGIEAIMITGTSTLVSWWFLSSTPFCENCNQWVKEKYSIAPIERIIDPEEFKSKTEQGDQTSLNTLKKIDSGTEAYTQIDLLHCPSCEQSCFLTVKSVEVRVDSDGKEKKDENNIMENFIINFETYGMIKEQW